MYVGAISGMGRSTASVTSVENFRAERRSPIKPIYEAPPVSQIISVDTSEGEELGGEKSVLKAPTIFGYASDLIPELWPKMELYRVKPKSIFAIYKGPKPTPVQGMMVDKKI